MLTWKVKGKMGKADPCCNTYTRKGKLRYNLSSQYTAVCQNYRWLGQMLEKVQLNRQILSYVVDLLE